MPTFADIMANQPGRLLPPLLPGASITLGGRKPLTGYYPGVMAEIYQGRRREPRNCFASSKSLFRVFEEQLLKNITESLGCSYDELKTQWTYFRGIKGYVDPVYDEFGDHKHTKDD